MNDIYNVWNGEKFEFTLRKICQIVFDGDSSVIPADFEHIADKPVAEVITHKTRKNTGIRVIFDVFFNQKASEKDIVEQIKSGLIVITPRTVKNENGQSYPSIYIDNPYEGWIKLGQYVKNVIPMPTIGITGSAGKTTSTMLAKCVFTERYKVFLSGENGENLNNLTEIVNQWIQRCNFNYNFHIQECGGGSPGLVEREARTICADMYGITNIDTAQHLSTYRTKENLIEDKTSFDRVRKNDNVVGVINIDDEILKTYDFSGKIITFGINNEEADYIGKNIVQNDEFLEFDIQYENNITHLKIRIVGKDNVYNALMVFAFAKHYGFTDEEISRGFLRYRSAGIRQRLDKVAGRYLYVDCFNASIASIFASLSALEDINKEKTCRRIAIIGERDSATDEIYSLNVEAGKKLGDYKKIDEFIILGENKPVIGLNGKIRDNAIFEGAKLTVPANKLFFFRNKNEVAQKLKAETSPGDVILLKGKLSLNMFCIFDLAFGTSYTLSRPILPKKVETPALNSEYYPLLLGLNLINTKRASSSTVSIPSSINNLSVVRIGDEAFANRSLLVRIILGSKVRTIGKKAFADCVMLEIIELPKETCYVDEEAFMGCSSLAMASLVGVGHIGREAFSGCVNLKKVILTGKCATIEEDVFKGCEKVTICAPSGSYAIDYAQKNHLRYEEINEKLILSRLMLNGTRRAEGTYFSRNYYEREEKNIESMSETYSCTDLSCVICGDIMTHGGQILTAFDPIKGDYDFDNYFADTYKYFQNADIAIGNLETTFGPGEYTGFPKFNSPDYLAESIAKSGIDIVACANNHIYDTKYAGIVRTKKICLHNGLLVTGIKKDEQDKAYCVIEKKGVKIGIINFTYRTRQNGNVPTLNLNPVDKEARRLFNSFSDETLEGDLDNVKSQIESAKADGAEIILVYYHWGCEYENRANVMQKYIAYKTACMGADAIIGSHPHVLQEKSEIKIMQNGKAKTVPVYYSLGNYIWGGFPMIGREGVLNTILAALNIKYDKENKCVSEIEAGYVPLKIQLEYTSGKWRYDVLSLNDMTSDEKEEYDFKNSFTVSEVKEQIERTLQGSVLDNINEEMRFDDLITIKQGDKINFIEKIMPHEKGVTLKSEQAITAAVLPNGELIAYSPGYVGITAKKENGDEIYFMVRVLMDNEQQKALPVLVDENNSVKDYYRPQDLVSGDQYGIPALCRITKRTAEAWLSMQKDAVKQGITLKCSVNGYLTNKEQLLRQIRYAEKTNMDEAQKRYHSIGCTEHHLGCAIDIMCVSSSSTGKNKGFQWILDNAHNYGFVARKSEKDIESMTYIHTRYVGDKEVAGQIYTEGWNVAEYLMNINV